MVSEFGPSSVGVTHLKENSWKSPSKASDLLIGGLFKKRADLRDPNKNVIVTGKEALLCG